MRRWRRFALLGCGATSGLAPVFNDAQVEAGSSVAVIGVGGLGLNTVQASALSGALTIIAVDLLEHRLDQAREFGATHAINAAEQDPIAEVRRISGGGVDYAFEVNRSAGDGAAGDPDGASGRRDDRDRRALRRTPWSRSPG